MMLSFISLRRLPPLLLLTVLVWQPQSHVVVQGSELQDPSKFFGGTIQTSDNDYWNWYQNIGAKQYEAAAFIPSVTDATLGAALHWSIDDDSDQENPYLNLAIAVRATGWLGLGLSENGGMQGADVLLFEKRNPTTVLDAYIRTELQPVLDDCQNWEFVSAVTDSEEYLIVQVRRLLDTGDIAHDRPIVNDGKLDLPPSLLIAAWGDSEEYSYHGPDHKARSSIRWYNNALDGKIAFMKIMEEQADGYFEMRAHNHTIPAEDTEYAQNCYTWEDLLAMGVPANTFSVIGFFPILDKIEHLHHFTLFGSHETMNGRPCADFAQHLDLVYGWARGEPPGALPPDVGMYVGPDSYQSFRLEIHYDNPKRVANVLDSSGVRFYYTKEVRPLEMGLLRLGDPSIVLNGTSLGVGLAQHIFDCPSTCSQTMLPEPVTVVREYLHMHYKGRSMKNELIRDGQVVHTGRVDYFNFDQMGNQLVQQPPFVVQPGDAFRTYCNYDNTGKNGTFGFSSQDEMCIVFIMYYPRQMYLDLVPWTCAMNMGFPPCETTHSSQELETLPRVFGPYDTDNDNEGGSSDTVRQAKAAGTTCRVDSTSDGSSSTKPSASSSPAMISRHWYVPVVTALAVAVILTGWMEKSF